jgi:tetratricopeptide (TPR) repeat protein
MMAATLLLACQKPAPAVGENPDAKTYTEVLAEADRSISTARWRIQQQPLAGYSHEELALALLNRARLAGGFEDYAEAESALDQAFEVGAGAGPLLTRAVLNFSLHRLPRVADDLARLQHQNLDATSVEVIGLRADLAFQRGQYAEALAGLRAALTQRETLSNLARLATWHARMGHASEAAALLGRAERLTPATDFHTRAWLALQQGLLLLDQGRWPEALAQYRRAQRLMPGWWLAREHEAEVLALQGEMKNARAIYASVVADTAHPEFMDAIAQILLAEGQTQEARTWIERARKSYENRAQQFPEANYGHALDHYLQFGNADQALALARANYRLRPNGDAATRLAAALVKSGRLPEAEKQVRSALATTWNTAELHAAACEVFRRTGQLALAQSEADKAGSLNPRWRRQYALATP